MNKYTDGWMDRWTGGEVSRWMMYVCTEDRKELRKGGRIVGDREGRGKD